jgi:hypothetical protein
VKEAAPFSEMDATTFQQIFLRRKRMVYKTARSLKKAAQTAMTIGARAPHGGRATQGHKKKTTHTKI